MADPGAGSGPRTGGENAPEDFEALAMPLLPSVTNFARWLTRDRDEAEELVQETYAKALRGYASFRPGTNFRAWLFRILKNAFLTSRTGLRERATVPLEADDGGPAAPATSETPESILVARASRELVRGAIEALPPAFREAVLLRDVEGLTYQEIAEALSIPVGTVMSRLARGRQAIREAIAKGSGGR